MRKAMYCLLVAMLSSSTIVVLMNTAPAFGPYREPGTLYEFEKHVGAKTESLIGYWKFDEGSGATAHDSSGNGNDVVKIYSRALSEEEIKGESGLVTLVFFEGFDDDFDAGRNLSLIHI